MLPVSLPRSFAQHILLSCAAILAVTASLFAQSPAADGFDPNVDGNVYAVAVQADGKTLIAGQFSLLQPNGALAAIARNNLARLNVDGSVDTAFNPDVNGPIRALVVQPNGQILIGGSFTSVAGVTRNRVARLNANGSVDVAFDPNIGGPIIPQVNALAVQRDGAVIVGGFFATAQPAGAAATTERRNLARFTSAGALDTSWNPSPNGVVLALGLQANDSILVGGGFTGFNANGSTTLTTRNRIGRVAADGTIEAFDPNANNAVESFAVQNDGKILVGGGFTSIAGTQVSRLVRLNANGTRDTTFSGGASGHVKAIALHPDGGIVVAGTFFSLWAGSSPATNRNHIGRFTPEGVVDASFTPAFNAEVSALAIQSDGKIVAGGYFTRANAAGSEALPTRNRVARLNANGSLDATFEPQTGGRPLASFTQADGKVIVAGSFTSVGGVTHAGMTRLNADGSVDSTFNPAELNGNIYVLLPLADGKFLIGGNFTRVGGAVHNRLARINADGSVDAAFTAGTDGSVTALARQADGAILVGGGFANVQSAPDTAPTLRSNIVRLTAAGGIDTAFNVSTDTAVQSIVVQADNKVLLGGNFTAVQAGGLQFGRSRIARINADGTMDTGFTAGFNEQVTSLGLQGDKIVVGGAFTQVAGAGATEVATRNRLARLNADGSLDTTFDPNANGAVVALLVQADGRIVIGGTFTSLQPAGDAEATTRNYLARLTPEGKVDSAFNLNFDTRGANRVDSLSFANNHILVGGSFASLQPTGAATRVARSNLVRIDSNGALDAGFEFGAVTGTTNVEINAIVLQPDGKIVVAGNFADVGGSANNDLARFNPEGTVDLSFNSAVDANGSIRGVAVRTNSHVLASHITGFAWLNADGTLRSSFAPAARFSGEINVAVTDAQGRVLLGGLFGNQTTGGGANLVRFNANGTLDTSFNPTVPDTVTHLVVQPDGKIIVVGNFTVVNGVTRRRIARLNADATLDTTFDPNPDGPVTAVLLQPDGKIVLGGEFRTFTANGGTAISRPFLARIESSGAVETAFHPNPNGAVFALARQGDGKLIAGGSFTTIQPGATGTAAERSGIARLNADGTLDTFNPKSNGAIYAVTLQNDGAILIGGEFTTITPPSGTAVSRSFLARLNSAGEVDTTFNPNPNRAVTEIVVETSGSILIAGNFSTLQPGATGGAVLRDRIARVTAAGAVDPTFNPDFTGLVLGVNVSPDNGVLVTGGFTGIQPNGLLVVGGDFTTIGGLAAQRLALLADDGSVSGLFQPNPNGTVRAVLALRDGGFLVGGDFTNIAGANRSYLARFKADNSLDTAFAPAVAGAVTALAQQPDGKLLVAAQTQVARFNSDGSPDASFASINVPLGVVSLALKSDGRIVVHARHSVEQDAIRQFMANGAEDAGFTVFTASNIRSLAVQADGGILVGRAAPLYGVTRLLANGSIDPAFSAMVNSSVNAVAVQPDGRVILGGNFTRVDGLIRVGLARLAPQGPVVEQIGIISESTSYTIVLTRTGPAAEITSVTFEISTDQGRTWAEVGAGTPLSSGGWMLGGVSRTGITGAFLVRARAVLPSSGGRASGLHELVRSFNAEALATAAPAAVDQDVAAFVIDPSSGAVTGVPSAAAGLYVGSAGQSPIIVGATSSSKLAGAASAVGANIVHANGNIYDQMLLTGGAATITADPGEVARISLTDYTNDIMQIEFSGAGSLTVTVDNPSAPAPATNYHQPGVSYVRGHPSIVIMGADETTNVSVFSVGPLTAIDQSLFRNDVTYDGVADLGYLAISSRNGKFGGVRTANVNYFATRGATGIYAPGVTFTGPVYIGDINGFDSAVAMLVLGSAAETSIAGGDLWQQNGHAVTVSGVTQLRFIDGTTSHGRLLPAQSNRAPLEQNEVDVSDQIVVNPAP